MCYICEKGLENVKCVLCPHKEGAFKHTTDGHFVHIACAYWFEECVFLNKERMEPVGCISKDGQALGIQHMPKWRFQLECQICHVNEGACVTCVAPGCQYSFHPLCGRQNQCVMENKPLDSAPSGKQIIVLCPHHSQQYSATVERDSPNTNNKGMVEWQAAREDDHGELYEGEVKDGIRHGHGTCVRRSGKVYEGEWRDGKEHGWGMLTDGKDFVIYEGEYSDGQIHGRGVYHFQNGDKYDGEWKENMRHGKGVQQETMYLMSESGEGEPTASIVTYDGEWKENRRHGRGRFECSDGSVYDGEWQDNMRHGLGILQLANGFKYEGQFKENFMDGPKGVAYYEDGCRYEGNWRWGKRDGRGTVHFPNGVCYQGRFKEDQIDFTYDRGILELQKNPVPANSEPGKDTCWMIPIEFQSDVHRIHLKAGFDKSGL